MMRNPPMFSSIFDNISPILFCPSSDDFLRLLPIRAMRNPAIGNKTITKTVSSGLIKTKLSKKIIILSAIDNLIKGGAGQAIQNMNIKYGFSLNEGLK